MGFQQGLSGLNVSSKNLDVIGNNVANSSTVGFKSGQAQFADVFAASLSGAGTAPVGLGAKLAAVSQQFTQGNITTTNNPLDLAINGGGFYIVSQPGTSTPFYSRNGQFSLDSTNNIVTNEGYRLQGYPVDSAGNLLVGSTPSDLTVSRAKIEPLATGGSALANGVQANLNLDSREAIIPATTTFDYTNPSTYNRSTALSVYDSLGNPHTYTMYFKKTAVNTWEVYSTVTNPAGATPAFADLSNVAGRSVINAIGAAATPAAASAAVAAASGAIDAAVVAAGGAAGAGPAATAAAAAAAALPGATLASVIAAAVGAAVPTVITPVQTLSFNTSGAITSTPVNQSISAAQLGYPAGVNPMSFPVDFSSSTQYGSTFTVNSLAQDGFSSGELAGFNVGADGIIKGRYTNGQSKNLGQIALANFANPQGLQPQGNNRWSVTSSSGVALINIPGAGGTGVLQSAAVEDSNVDLTQELVNMITAQRVYQANAQTIKTQDQVLQTLVNLR